MIFQYVGRGRLFLTVVSLIFLLGLVPKLTVAQVESNTVPATTSATTSELIATTSSDEVVDDVASATAANIVSQRRAATEANPDVTQPEEPDQTAAIISRFAARPVNEPTVLNFMAYWVQQSVQIGIPANTIFLILLTPFLALLVSFVRVIVGLPTLDMLVPIALAFAFVAVGVTVGLFVLGAIIFASYVSKRLLARLRIMFYPKRSLSMLLLALCVFAALTIALLFDFERILSLSIFPILILMLLGDLIVTTQMHKSGMETFTITSTTIGIGLMGYVFATSNQVQDLLILYPELVLLTIPANILIGRYFGLRLLEFVRFGENREQ
jgi:hypothetical protein